MKRSIINDCYKIAVKKNKQHPQWGCYHHYAFIIQRNKIVEWATNRAGEPNAFLGFPRHAKVHAETEAYRKARGILEKNKPFEVINIRLNRGGDLKPSKPCACCTNFLKLVDCAAVWFSTGAGFARLW